MRNLLGGKGANLAEMTSLGLPVPQGFTVTTEACTQYYEDGRKINDEIMSQIMDAIVKLEEITGKKFGDKENPLLVSVRSGARASMPGMMDTILNLGLNEEVVEEKGLLESAEFLYALLNCRVGRETSEEDFASDEIIPTADDRMHVFCLLRDAELSRKISTMDWKHPRNSNEEEFQKLLYSIVFVDPEWPTCQNAEMRADFLEKALYLRWQEWGTIYSVTSFSFFCMTGESDEIVANVLRPFMTEYLYLLSLVLAQRIGIAGYSGKAGRIVRGVDKKGMIDKAQAETLINLQEKYITFKNQILILEASCQEQGIDIYHLLQNQMMIQEEQAILDEQLESLYEATNVSQGNRDAWWQLWIAIGAIVIDVIVNIIAIVADHGWSGMLQWLYDILGTGV